MRLERFMPDTQQATRDLIGRTFNLAARWMVLRSDLYEMVLIGDIGPIMSGDPDSVRTRVLLGWSDTEITKIWDALLRLHAEDPSHRGDLVALAKEWLDLIEPYRSGSKFGTPKVS